MPEDFAPETQTESPAPEADTSWMPTSQKVHLADEEHLHFSPQALMQEGPIVILDTETTGLDHKTESLLEIGAVKLENGEVVETFSTLINPQQPIRHSSFKVHNISEEMIADAPTIDVVVEQFHEFIGDLPYAAHNVVFDYSFMTEAYKKHLGKRFLNPRICTQELFLSLFPEEPSHGLQALSAKLGTPQSVEHRALDDAMQLARVYPKLRKLYLQKHAWKFSQLENINYLLERYMRLQKTLQTLQSEMADLKDIFKLYFAEGGHPVRATSGEVLTAALRRNYDYDSEALAEVIDHYNLMKHCGRLNLKQVDRLIGQAPEKSPLTDEMRQALIATRKAISQHWTIDLKKPGQPSRRR